VKRWIVFAGIALVAVVVVLVLGFSSRHGVVEWRVRVPGWTPAGDAIVLHFSPDEHEMKLGEDGAYHAFVDTGALASGETLSYGYSRGGFLAFAETGYQQGEPIRSFKVGSSTLVSDEVKAWKWMSGPHEPLDVGSTAATAAVAPRPRFWAGPTFVDFWNPEFARQYNASVAHLHGEDLSWIALAPPWDWNATDPLPVVTGAGDVTAPAWSDADLVGEIRAFHDAGIHVLLEPQICCRPIDYANRSDAWWHAYYDEQERFTRHFADVCKAERVEAFAIGGNDQNLPGTPTAPSFAHEAWQRHPKKTPNARRGCDFLSGLPSSSRTRFGA